MAHSDGNTRIRTGNRNNVVKNNDQNSCVCSDIIEMLQMRPQMIRNVVILILVA